MSYKTILMHCNDKRRMETLLPPSLSLAETFQAHLIGLSVVPPVAVISTGMPSGPPIVLDDHCKLYREENPAMKSAFEAATRGRAFVGEWRDDEADAFGVGDRVLQYARAVDLVVAAQTDPQWAGTEWLDVADRLAMESGRPVLIIPNTGAHAGAGEKVLIAWNARREAARAVFDALPILQRAKEVKVVWINPQSEHELARDIPAADICAALARHGVKCQATEQVKPRAGVGETLLACAKDMGRGSAYHGILWPHALARVRIWWCEPHILMRMQVPVLGCPTRLPLRIVAFL